jgi:hypothetical protein
MSLVDDNKLFGKLGRFSRQLFVRAHLALFPWLHLKKGGKQHQSGQSYQ